MNETNVVVDPIPAQCEVCGRRDETVRFVVYPYVVSLIVVTFQRAFNGCWCRVHRIPRWLAATLITSIFGWLGFPFGLVFTPVRLLQLARGGLQDKNINGRILRSIGEEKYRNGDLRGAIRCLEASLLYVDEPEVNEQLRALYRSQSTGAEVSTSSLSSFFAFPAIAMGYCDSVAAEGNWARCSGFESLAAASLVWTPRGSDGRKRGRSADTRGRAGPTGQR